MMIGANKDDYRILHTPVVLARKPLSEKTIAANVLKYGTGALNIDGCRVGTESTLVKRPPNSLGRMNDDGWKPKEGFNGSELGRFPANLIHDGSEAIEAEFAKYGERKSGGGIKGNKPDYHQDSNVNIMHSRKYRPVGVGGDTGTASRFFYAAKDTDDNFNGLKEYSMDDCKVIHNDCMDAMRELIAKGIQVDSIVTDPPYGIRFMGCAWDGKDINKVANEVGGFAKSRTSMSSGTYDNSLTAMSAFQCWTHEWAKLVFQLLKSGGHLLCFSSPRTYHRMASGIEDAGFEIRDQLMWIFGQGFPKSLDISKAIDKTLGVERKIIGKRTDGRYAYGITSGETINENVGLITEPATELAKQWQGFGTALKPAHEPIVLARKPLSEKTIAANVLRHGTGGINVDGCRVGTDNMPKRENDGTYLSENTCMSGFNTNRILTGYKHGRFPANLIHDGSDEVEEEFAKQSEAMGMHSAGQAKRFNPTSNNHHKVNAYSIGKYAMPFRHGEPLDRDLTASRFYYSAKASKRDRAGSKHPTVKPIALMRYLCRLITPPNGTVLDPFAGSGTTGQAAIEEGFKVILIEKEADYIKDIHSRLGETHDTAR